MQKPVDALKDQIVGAVGAILTTPPPPAGLVRAISSRHSSVFYRTADPLQLYICMQIKLQELQDKDAHEVHEAMMLTFDIVSNSSGIQAAICFMPLAASNGPVMKLPS